MRRSTLCIIIFAQVPHDRLLHDEVRGCGRGAVLELLLRGRQRRGEGDHLRLRGRQLQGQAAVIWRFKYYFLYPTHTMHSELFVFVISMLKCMKKNRNSKCIQNLKILLGI